MTTTTDRHGLANVGNTCYLNSAIQCLSHSAPFRTYLGTAAWEKHRHPERKGGALAEETAGLVAALNAPGNKVIVPTSFAHAFVKYAREYNDEIRFGAQADAAEAIQILLDGLHTQLSREVRMEITGTPSTKDHAELIRSLESWATFFRKEYSPLVESFYGQTQTTVTCAGCNSSSTRYEPWGVFKLPIPGAERAGAPAPNLHECIRAALAPETLEDYACDGCKKKGAARITHAISRYPSHLILSLKRFTNTGAKVRARIPYHEDNVDLVEWRAWPALQPANTARYRVMSLIEHMGSSHGGHYYMRAREGREWVTYDDASVSPAQDGGAGPDTYVLFLERY